MSVRRINKHNRLDYDCKYWVGDMRPNKGDLVNTELNERFTSVTDRRCVYCRPYSSIEGNELLDIDLFQYSILVEV